MNDKFHNRTTEDLADEYGDYKERHEAIGAHLDILKDELKKRIDDAPAVGARWTVSTSVSKGRVTLDTKRLKADLGESIVAEYETVGEPTISLRVKKTKLAHLEMLEEP